MIATNQPISSIPTGLQYYIYDNDYNISEIDTTVTAKKHAFIVNFPKW